MEFLPSFSEDTDSKFKLSNKTVFFCIRIDCLLQASASSRSVADKTVGLFQTYVKRFIK